MKKFLSLVLALVMAMSLVTISAGAASFSDKSSIDYDEAIEVMNAIEVVSGYGDGTFRPDAVLTRGAASKIICNMLLGPTSAAALSVNSAPFSDVAADSTFAGYIAYMVKEGIVSGYSDGTFRPGANLTGYAFMKMLLTALGYNAQMEGYVGANWSVAVAKRALSIGLDSGLEDTFNGLRPVTRQEACLYALNTLKADMVDYGNITNIVAPGVNITTTAKAEPVTSTSLASRNQIDGTGDIVQLGEKVFTKLALTTDVDDFGHPGNKWTLGAKTIGNYAKKAEVTFDKETSASSVAKAMTAYKIGYQSGHYKIDNDTKRPNGAQLSLDDNGGFYKNGTSDNLTFDKARTIADYIASLTENNDKLVEIYVNSDNYITYIVQTTFRVGKVTRASTNSKGNTSYSIESKIGTSDTTTGIDYADGSASDSNIFIEGTVKVDDIVTYAKLKGNKTYVYPTTNEAGTISKVSDDNLEVTMGGTTYNAWKDNNTMQSANSATIYIDYLGRAAWVDTTTDSSVYWLAGTWRENPKGANHYYAQLVSMGGDVQEIEITPSTYSGIGKGGDMNAWDRVLVQKGTAQSGKTPLTQAVQSTYYFVDPDTTQSTYKLDNTVKRIGPSGEQFYYVSNDVKLLYVKNSGDELKVSLVDGLQTVRSLKTYGFYCVLSDTAPYSVKTIVIPQKSPTEAAGDLLFQAKWTQGWTVDKADKRAPMLDLYLDGEKDSYVMDNDNQLTKDPGFYEFSVDEATGRYKIDRYTDNAAYVYLGVEDTASRDAVLALMSSKRYIDMYQLSSGSAAVYTKVSVLDNKSRDPFDAKGATFYDLTDYNIGSISDLYNVIDNYSTESADAKIHLLLFGIYDDKTLTYSTIYVMDASKADGSYNWFATGV